MPYFAEFLTVPELPEIAARARQMDRELAGKTITQIEVFQPKCLNLPGGEFSHSLVESRILSVSHKGKWLFVETTRGWLLLNMGMGGELLLVTRATLPEKVRIIFDFSDGSCLAVNFWWFGYAHFVPTEGLALHSLTASLGPNALDLPLEEFNNRLQGQRGRLKSWLLDQKNIAGIGNAYIHDILFLARLHPLRQIATLTDAEISALHAAIHAGLQPSLDLGGAFYEVDLHGIKGGFTFDRVIIGYREGQPCPACQAPIQKIKTGSTSSFICPHCQV